jgi:Bacterial lectin
MNSSRFSKVLWVAICGLMCVAGQRAQAQGFSIPLNGFTAANVCSSSTQPPCQVATNGSATAAVDDHQLNVLRLTAATGNQAGSAWFSTQQPFANGFDAKFKFRLSGGSGADGIAFVLQNSASGLAALGFSNGNGGALAYGDDDANSVPASGIESSVAFEFDTFQNGWDPNSNHVAIQSCGSLPNTSHHTFTIGESPVSNSCPTSDGFLNPTLGITTGQLPVTFADGNPHDVEIIYVAPSANCQIPGCMNLTVSVDGNQILSVSTDLTTQLGNVPVYVGFTGATGALTNNQDIQSWSYAPTSASTPPQHINPGTPIANVFNGAQGQLVQEDLTFPTVDNGLQYPAGVDPNSVQLTAINTLVSNSAGWPQYVSGTPWATTSCFVKSGDGGNNCSLYGNVCFDNTHPPSDLVCPFVAPGSNSKILIADKFDASTKPAIAPGTTAALIHFYPASGETWSPATGTNPACTDPTGAANPATDTSPAHCDLTNVQNFSLTGDPTTSGGTSRKGMFASVFGVPMLETAVSVNGTQVNKPGVQSPPSNSWFKTRMLNFNFLVNPAQVPSPPNNGAVAAPVNQFTYGITQGANTVVADKTFFAADTSLAQPVDFTDTQTLLQDGVYSLHWFSLDNVGIKEQNVQFDQVSSTYSTNLFNVQLNVDSTAPTITITTPANGANYSAKQKVQANYSCTDNLSGVATCVGTVPNGSYIDTTPAGAGLTQKTFTVNSTDVAGNSSSATNTYYVSCHYASVTVSPTTVNRGGKITVTSSVADCVNTAQTIKVQFVLTGPLGRNCGNSSTVMFTTPSFTVQPGTSNSFSFPFFIPYSACSGSYTINTNTISGGIQIDNVSSSLTVH